MRILIIEDDQELCQTLAYRLKKEGIASDLCHDGAEGLEIARGNAYDLILLDRMLPSLSGTDLLAQYRREGFVTPVILVGKSVSGWKALTPEPMITWSSRLPLKS